MLGLQSFAEPLQIPGSQQLPWGGGFLHLSHQDDIYIHRHYQQTRVKRDALFPIASLSKQMTSYLVYKMIHLGVIQESTSLKEVFPELSGGTATVKDLLNHRSGIDDYVSNTSTVLSFGNFNCENLNDFAETQPDQNFSYSNKGYCLLAKILEKKTQRSFAVLMNEHVFAPLGMKSTRAAEIDEVFPDLIGFSPISADLNRYIPALPQNYLGSANVLTTADDLVLWKHALKDPEFLPPAFLQRIRAELVKAGDRGLINERGLEFRIMDGELHISHIGKLEGHTSFMVYYPSSDVFGFALADMATQDIEIGLMAPGFIERLKRVIAQ